MKKPQPKKKPEKTVAIKSKPSGERATGDEIEELNERRVELEDQLYQAYEKIDDLEHQIAAAKLNAEAKKLEPSEATVQDWTRGKLANDRFIKINKKTGEWFEIDETEWDSLAWA